MGDFRLLSFVNKTYHRTGVTDVKHGVEFVKYKCNRETTVNLVKILNMRICVINNILITNVYDYVTLWYALI